VEIGVNGRRHRGSYTIQHGLLTVRYALGGSKSTRLEHADADGLAQLLLLELVGEKLALWRFLGVTV
jgi:hypothetical protein